MGIFDGWSKRRAEKKHIEKIQERIDDANSIFQIKEYEGRIWLTFCGNRVCPTEMFEQKDPVEVLNKIRDLYIKEDKKWIQYAEANGAQLGVRA
jgi:hypothetical protein